VRGPCVLAEWLVVCALSPLIAIGLITAYKPETWPISVFMIVLASITIVSVYFATETRKKAEA